MRRINSTDLQAPVSVERRFNLPLMDELFHNLSIGASNLLRNLSLYAEVIALKGPITKDDLNDVRHSIQDQRVMDLIRKAAWSSGEVLAQRSFGWLKDLVDQLIPVYFECQIQKHIWRWIWVAKKDDKYVLLQLVNNTWNEFGQELADELGEGLLGLDISKNSLIKGTNVISSENAQPQTVVYWITEIPVKDAFLIHFTKIASWETIYVHSYKNQSLVLSLSKWSEFDTFNLERVSMAWSDLKVEHLETDGFPHGILQSVIIEWVEYFFVVYDKGSQGYGLRMIKVIEDSSPEDWQESLSVNIVSQEQLFGRRRITHYDLNSQMFTVADGKKISDVSLVHGHDWKIETKIQYSLPDSK